MESVAGEKIDSENSFFSHSTAGRLSVLASNTVKELKKISNYLKIFFHSFTERKREQSQQKTRTESEYGMVGWECEALDLGGGKVKVKVGRSFFLLGYFFEKK